MNVAKRNPAIKLVLALALLAPAAAQGKPQVAVDFDIEATKYKRNLYKEVDAVEGTLEASLAAIGNEKFAFLDWIAGHSAPERSAFSATLQASIVDGASGALGPSIWLKLSAKPEAAKIFDCGRKSPVPVRFESTAAVRLFSGAEPQSGKAKDLQERVEQVLLHQLGNGALGHAFAKAFLNQIPICDKVEIPLPSFPKHIALGIDRNELHLDPRAKIAFRPCSQFPGEQQVDGVIDLDLTEASVGNAPLVQTRVVSCYVPPRENEVCIEAIPRILQYRLSKGADVFMKQYVWTFDGTDGLRTTAP